MSVQLSSFLTDVLPAVPKCSELLAAQSIKDAVIQFFKDSKVYNTTLTPIDVVANTAQYALPNPTGWQIMHVRWAEFDRKGLTSTSEEELDLTWADGRTTWRTETNGTEQSWRYAIGTRANAFYQPNPNSIVLLPNPDTAYTSGLVINVVAHPTPDVTTIEDWVYNSHYLAISSLAISSLMYLKNKPFSDARMAAELEQEYYERVGKLEDAALRGYQRNDQPVRRAKTWSK